MRCAALLVTGEVALALVLLSGAGLLMRSFYRLQSVDVGFDPHNVLTFRINLPRAKYAKDEQQLAFFDRALDEIRALPGVVSAGGASIFPLAGDDYLLSFTQVGKPPKPPGQEDNCMYYAATPGYFEALHIPLKAGRYFTKADAANAPADAIISESMAKQLLPERKSARPEAYPSPAVRCESPPRSSALWETCATKSSNPKDAWRFTNRKRKPYSTRCISACAPRTTPTR